MIRVLLADDHHLVRAGMKSLLEKSLDIRVVAEASDGLEAVTQFKALRPDVVILDISMPNMDGLEAAKYILSIDQSAAILILTMYPEKQYAVRAIRAGALGYITKSASTSELHAAVRNVAVKKRFLLEEGVDALSAGLSSGKAGAGPVDSLSDRELQVLRLIARGRKVKEISQELDVRTKTVETYRSRILRKLGLRNNAELCRFAFENALLDG
ncbi:MAG: response regulator transcription factor [Dehalococcoidia bacterium]|nr:response regulator transcription factor [Dehalococcoidia bacterium]